MFVGANAVVLDETGRVHLIHRGDILTWALPGGSLEPNELPPDGLAREVAEETGLKVLPQRLTGLNYLTAGRSSYLQCTFLCRFIGSDLQKTKEALQVGFQLPERLPRPLQSLHRERLAQALSHKGGPPSWGQQRPSPWPQVARRTVADIQMAGSPPSAEKSVAL